MSLRSVGNQLLQTAPSPLLAGASTSSLSLWLRVNPGCNVANAAGVVIFGDAGGKVTATLSGSGGLQLAWSSNNGKTNSRSTCNLTLTPGTSYHLAAVWQAGSQQYFLNGVQVGSDVQVGSLGVLGDAAPHPFRLGSDSAGADVTLDEPTLWVGYALGVQDVRNLRDRIVHPEGVAPASIALAWSLAGPDGVAAHVGDAGLADASATGLNLSSVVGSAPTYQAGVLTYAPAAKIGTASVGPSGESIIVVVEDGTGAPANLKALKSTNNVQLLNLSGPPAGGSFTLAFGGQSTAPIPVTSGPPLAYGLWTVPVAAGVSQQIAATWSGNSGLSSDQLFEIFDTNGTTPLGSLNCDFTKNPTSFVDGLDPAGENVNWQNLATVTPTGATITIRISSTAGFYFVASGIRVLNTATSAKTYINDRTAGAYAVTGASPQPGNNQVHWYNGTNTAATGTGVGTRYSINPSAIQSALLALSSVQAGGLTVTAADSNNNGPYTVQFAGPMGGASQPPITASDPTIVPSMANAGGDFPSISINSGPPIPLKSPIWGPGLPNGVGGARANPYLPYVFWPLPQSAPPTQFCEAFDGLFAFNGPNNTGPVGYANPTLLLTGGGTATWTFPCQQAGTYKVSTTWAAGASSSTAAVFTVAGSLGATLATVTVNQTLAPSDFTDAGVGWKVLGTFTVPAGTDITVSTAANASNVVADTTRLDRTGADTSIVIKPTDVVTLNASEGWAATAAGPVDGATALPLTNLVGGSSLPAFAPVPKTMRVGYNIEGEQPYGQMLIYANVAKRIQWGGGVVATDSNAYPTKLTGSYVDLLVCGGSPDSGGEGKGLACFPNGNYTFLWDGTCDLTPSGGGDTVATVVGTPVITKTTNNRRVFNFQAGPSTLSPSLWLRVHGTAPDPADPTGKSYLCDLQNLRIYPPGVDPSNPPTFHPSFVSKIQGMQSLRFLDPLATNSGNVRNFTDFNTASRVTYFDTNQKLNIPIAQIAAYSGASGFDSVNGVILQITTTAPHGLTTGIVGQVQPNSSGTPVGTVLASNGTYSTSFGADRSASVVQVTSPTTFLISLAGDSSHPNRAMTNVITGDAAGVFHVEIGSGGMVFTDCVALCNQVGADMYLNIPPEATDACVTSMAAYVAANLKPGLKVRVEFANECWNYSFNAYASCCLKSVIVLGGNPNYYPPYYVYRMQQVHNLCAAALAAAGRPGDLVRVMGTQGANPGLTVSLVALAKQAGAPIDEVAVAPYLDNQSAFNGNEPTLTPTFNLMTTGQNLDLYEMNILFGQNQSSVSGHRPALDGGGYTSTRIICYEGGPDQALPWSSTANFNRRSHAAIRHPRMFGVMLGYLQNLQNAGCSLFNDYAMNYYAGPPVWGAYYGWNMQPGTGNPTLDAINITNPEAVDQIKSEVGGAMNLWASLSGPAKSPIPPQLKTSGYRRGTPRQAR